MLKTGDRIPNFDLVTDRGERVSPKTLKGARAVLYFYPKDDTPGCTREACAFRDALPNFDAAKVRGDTTHRAEEAQAGEVALGRPLVALAHEGADGGGRRTAAAPRSSGSASSSTSGSDC